MCLWNRPGQIDDILRRLDQQVGVDQGIRLVLWNNCAEDRTWYDERIAAFEPTGSLASIEIVHSAHNIRGVGRFIAAKWLWNKGVRGSFLMLDDDEIIPANGLATLLAAGGPQQIASLWAWRVNPDDYCNVNERSGVRKLITRPPGAVFATSP